MTWKIKPHTTVAALAVLALDLSGCRYGVQTSSGADYLSSYPRSGLVEETDIDRQVRDVAAVEPTLRFPARIGLARIHEGALSAIPAAEAEAWIEAERRLGPEYGTFVPINRLVAEMVAPRSIGPGPGNPRLRQVVEKIRLGAARQHVDAVLIYETHYITDATDNLLSVADFTIVGAFLLPGQSIDATAFASALLVDVRNGYPYGTANVAIDEDRIATLASVGSVSEELGRDAGTAAAIELVDDVEQMFIALKQELDLAASPGTTWREP